MRWRFRLLLSFLVALLVSSLDHPGHGLRHHHLPPPDGDPPRARPPPGGGVGVPFLALADHRHRPRASGWPCTASTTPSPTRKATRTARSSTGFWSVQLGNVFHYVRGAEDTRAGRTLRARHQDGRLGPRALRPRPARPRRSASRRSALVLGIGWGLLAAAFHAFMYVFVLSSSINGLCHYDGYKNFDNTATNIRLVALADRRRRAAQQPPRLSAQPEVQLPPRRVRSGLAGHQAVDASSAWPVPTRPSSSTRPSKSDALARPDRQTADYGQPAAGLLVCRPSPEPRPARSPRYCFKSRRMRRAAFRPGAPMMPPPGCVAEPHR